MIAVADNFYEISFSSQNMRFSTPFSIRIFNFLKGCWSSLSCTQFPLDVYFLQNVRPCFETKHMRKFLYPVRKGGLEFSSIQNFLANSKLEYTNEVNKVNSDVIKIACCNLLINFPTYIWCVNVSVTSGFLKAKFD